MRILMAIAAVMCLMVSLSALEINVDISALSVQEKSGNLLLLTDPGKPMLDYYSLKVLLPFGEEYEDAMLVWGESRNVSRGIELDFAKDQLPISFGNLPSRTTPDPDVYQRNEFFPYRDFEYLGTQYYRGYAIAIFNVYPMRYNPVSKELMMYTSFNMSVNSRPRQSVAEKQALYLSDAPGTIATLNRMVENPNSIAGYRSAPKQRHHSRNLDPEDAKSMIIITSQSRIPWFDEYISWRESKGISTGIYSTEFIYANYTGEDSAEKVRNFVIDAYLTMLGTANPLEYVLLGGDDEIVPERGVFGNVGSTVDNRMPSDLYYSNLDGDWNANGNSIYGELQDNTDMVPELHIGRFPAESLAEFQNIFRKNMYYIDNNTYSNNIAVFFGENLNNNPMTWGGDYKDDVAQYLPDGYSFSTHYQRDGTYDGAAVGASIRNGANVMNHMGHANETFLMGQSNTTVALMKNTEYGFLYSQGCYPAAFDQRTSADGESIGEHLLTSAGALFAFVGNTRYGWYMPGGIDGASQFYDRQFFIGLYQMDLHRLGEALSYSREANLGAALSSDVMRWCYMEMILFGDPSIGLKLPDPDLPMLNLLSYEIDDSLGDGDGTINPGDIIRIKPVISNAAGWGTAYDVSLRIVATPVGVEPLSTCIMISELAPGAQSGPDLELSLQLLGDSVFGSYTLKAELESFDPVTHHSTGIKHYDINYDITLIDSNFPYQINTGGKSAPMVVDADGDGHNDILYLDVFGGVHVVNTDGQETSSFNTPEEIVVFNSAAMGQIDNEDGDDIVILDRSGKVYAMNLNGDLILDYEAPAISVFSPVIADLDGNGSNEILFTGFDSKLYVIDHEGNDYPGFPLLLDSVVQTDLAVGKLNPEGPMQIVGGQANGDLLVVNPDATLNPDYDINLGDAITGSPVILDNGKIGIATNTNLFLVGNSGIEFSVSTQSRLLGGLITADINRDGSLDLVCVSNRGVLFAVSQSGEHIAGFPVDTGELFNCPPLVADLDGDDQYEIVLHSMVNNIFIYNHDGSLVDGYPFFTSYTGATPGTLLDLENNGYFKLVTGFSNGVLLSNLRAGVSNLAPWTVYRGALNRQASFAATGYVDNEDHVQTPVFDRLSQNYPNPFNPHTIIAFDLGKAQNISLDIYNTKGQLVRNLATGQMGEGNHRVTWNGKDNTGRSLASGIYFYRLKTESYSSTRKMLLLK